MIFFFWIFFSEIFFFFFKFFFFENFFFWNFSFLCHVSSRVAFTRRESFKNYSPQSGTVILKLFLLLFDVDNLNRRPFTYWHTRVGHMGNFVTKTSCIQPDLFLRMHLNDMIGYISVSMNFRDFHSAALDFFKMLAKHFQNCFIIFE